MTFLDLTALSGGDRITADLLVMSRSDRRTKAGDPFVVLTLGNSSGQIETAPIWSNQLDWAEGAKPGAVVQVAGAVEIYAPKPGAAKRQLSISAPVRPVDTAQVDVASFLPRIPYEPARLWETIDKARAELRSPAVGRTLDLFFANEAFRRRFEVAPGSPGAGHHAQVGGLLLHVTEVLSIGKHIARTARANVDLVVAGALLHDIGKVEAYSVTPAGFGHTACGALLGHVVLGALMLERALARAGTTVCTDEQQLELQHMILSHHGSLEFGSPVQPMTLEAEILHWADQASAKATDMNDAMSDPEVFTSGGELSDNKAWRLGRRVWRRSYSWDE